MLYIPSHHSLSRSPCAVIPLVIMVVWGWILKRRDLTLSMYWPLLPEGGKVSLKTKANIHLAYTPNSCIRNLSPIRYMRWRFWRMSALCYPILLKLRMDSWAKRARADIALPFPKASLRNIQQGFTTGEPQAIFNALLKFSTSTCSIELS